MTKLRTRGKTERLNLRLTPYQKKQVRDITRLGPHATESEAVWFAIQCYHWCLENKKWPFGRKS